MNPRSSHQIAVLAAAAIAFQLDGVSADDARLSPIRAGGLDRLLAVIKPQPDESPWREIAWLTDVTEARARAVLEDKPLVIFTAADGSPLGRT